MFIFNREWLYEIAQREVKRSQKKTLKTDPSDQPIKSVSIRQINRTSQSEAFPEDKTRFRLVQSDHSGRTYKSDASSYGQDSFFVQSDSFGDTSDGPYSSRPIISFGRNFGRTSDGPYYVSSNQIPSDGLQTDHLLSRTTRFHRRDFRRTIFRLVQSYPSDGLSDELQTDHIPSRPIRFLRTDFRWTIFRLVQSDHSDGY